MRNIFACFLFVFCFALLTGCTSVPVVKVNHVLVTPADNLLVDCDIAPPPKKVEYLNFAVMPSDLTASDVVAQFKELQQRYITSLNSDAEQERQLTATLMANYKYQGECNARWKALREWKANATKELSTPGGG